MYKNMIFFVIVLSFISCTDERDGDWEDNIKLSQKEFQFDSSESSANIKTEGDSWWISEVFFKDGETTDLSNLDTTSGSFTITESEFILERSNGRELSVKLFENTTGFERTFVIGLQAGNYFDGITIIQAAD
jgi:hypothetical protein